MIARPPVRADAAEAAALSHAYFDAFLPPGVATRKTAEQILRLWSRFDLERDGLALRDGDRLGAVGLLDMLDDVLELAAEVDPGLTGRGLGTRLVAWAEEEAVRRRSATVRASHLAGDTAGRELLEARGYSYARSLYVMRIELDAAPPTPVWPAGAAVCPAGERELYAVLEESFAGEWGHVPQTFEEWLEEARSVGPDPALWFLVRSGGEPVAAAICEETPGPGWVWSLGVRPAWRRRGLARALLVHSFRELFAAGRGSIRLSVDASNESGAVRLYESAGMQVSSRRDFGERSVL